MSEYQYYEFVAVDQALTPAQQDELREVSTRGRITSTSFVNEYEWGDLKADPVEWVKRYFDAHLYLANWGSRRIMLRLPKAVLSPKTAALYCVNDSARSWTTRTHVVMEFSSENEGGDEDWWDEEGRLAEIIPARADLAAGDRRLLYLAWLLCVQNLELDDDDLEPPVPAGLATLSGSLRVFAHFLRIDPDLLAVAATASGPLKNNKKPPAAALRRWVKELPEEDKDEVLLQVLRGDTELLQSQLLSRFRGVTEGPPPAEGRRTAGELHAAAEARWSRRQHEEQEQKADELRRRAEAAAAERAEYVDALLRDPVRAWNQVDELIATKSLPNYDAAVVLLQDLQSLTASEEEIFAFERQIAVLRERHAGKKRLIERFDKARLD